MRQLSLLVLLAGCGTPTSSIDDARFGSAVFARGDGEVYPADMTMLLLTSGDDACALGEQIASPNMSPAAVAEAFNAQVGPDGWFLQLFLGADADAMDAGTEIRMTEWGESAGQGWGMLANQHETLTESDFSDVADPSRLSLYQTGDLGAFTVEERRSAVLSGELRAPFFGIDPDGGGLTGTEESVDTFLEAVDCPEMTEAMSSTPELTPGPNMRDPSCDGSDGTWCGCELVGTDPALDPDSVLGIGQGGDGELGVVSFMAQARSDGYCVQVDLLGAGGAHERHEIPYVGSEDWGPPEGVVHDWQLDLASTGTYVPGTSTTAPSQDWESTTQRVSVWSPEGALVFCLLQGPEQSLMEGLPCGW